MWRQSKFAFLVAMPAALLLGLMLTSGSSDGQQNSYVGASTCGSCHAAQLVAQSASAHAHSLSPAALHPLAAFFSPAEELVRPPRYRFRYTAGEDGLRVRVSDGSDVVEVPIQWAFGAGEKAVTFVSRLDKDEDDEDWHLEHYFSYYASTQALGPTPGHMGLRSNTLPLALGLRYRTADPVTGVVKCFECHSTGPPAVSPAGEIEPAELGVRCEACHGPGSLHVQAASAGNRERAREFVTNPGKMSASQLNQFCGRCHRAPVGGPVIDWSNAWNVRHQPIYLNRSACFLQSQGALSCLTCHSPHEKLERSSARYDEKCASCHVEARHPQASGYEPDASCVGCHMPQVQAQKNMEFTNHWIGVYGEEKLQPR